MFTCDVLLVGFSTKSDDCTSVDIDADTRSIGPDGSEGGQANAAFDSADFSMIMNDPTPSVEVPVEIRESLNPAMDGDTIGPMASLGPDSEESSFAAPVHASAEDSGKVNFRHAQFRGLKLSHPGAGTASFL